MLLRVQPLYCVVNTALCVLVKMTPAVWTLNAAARVSVTVHAFPVHCSLRVQVWVRAGCMVGVDVGGVTGAWCLFSPSVCM